MRKLAMLSLVVIVGVLLCASVYASDKPVVTAIRVPVAPEIDGQVVDTAWIYAAQTNSKTVVDNHRGSDFHLSDVVFLTYDDTYLYVALVCYVFDPFWLDTEGAAWGQGDGVEVCFQNDAGVIFSIQGFPSGKFNVTTPYNPGTDVTELVEATLVAAQIGFVEWTIEFAIPFAEYGIEVAPDKLIPFNIGARKEDINQWTAWIGTGGSNYDVQNAGFLKLIERENVPVR